MSINFDDLYALRLYHLDTIQDEFEIIKRLKIELFNSGIRNSDSIDNFLVDFYKFLPKRLFICIFYILSPLYLKIIYQFSSGLYNSMQNIKSKLRITRK